MGLRCWVIFDAHGAGPEEYAFAAPNPDRRWLAQLEREEKAILSSADEVICVSKVMQEHYREKYKLQGDQWSVVPCATNAAVGWDVRARARLRQEFKLEERFVFVYAGSYRKYQMADEMVALFKAIKQELSEAYFLILTGDRARFASAASIGGLAAEDYRIVSLSHEEVLQTLPVADVGFLLRADSPVNRVASPTKFAEYCICGVPVLLTPYVGDYSRAVEDAQLGCCLEELSVSPRLLRFLRDVQEHREAFAVRCHHYAIQHLTWASAGTTLRGAYDRLSSAPAGQAPPKEPTRRAKPPSTRGNGAPLQS
jgi:glycosyltransferase involved in cell wall biosynthesis